MTATLLCIDCGLREATDEYDERCAPCAARRAENLTPEDCPPDWFAGGFAENH